MLKRFLAHLPVLAAAALTPLMAANTAATVTEAVNEVSHGTSQSAVTEPAKSGTQIADGEYLKTGVKSRAELQLANQSVTRLGANTIFNYSVANNEVDLQAGTILFSKPKNGAEMTIKTASVTAAIVGTSGFAYVHGNSLLFGLIEGHARLSSGGVPYNLTAGQILQIPQGGKPQSFFYNIPLFLSTSPLLTKFHSTLPNQPYIDEEVRKYKEFAARGFVGPPSIPFFITGVDGSVPILPIPARDSAGNALNKFNNPPPPPPMSMPTSNPFFYSDVH